MDGEVRKREVSDSFVGVIIGILEESFPGRGRKGRRENWYAAFVRRPPPRHAVRIIGLK